MAKLKKIPLLALSLDELQRNGRFVLIVSLNEADKILAKLTPPIAIPRVVDGNTFKATVLDADGAFTGSVEIAVANASTDRNLSIYLKDCDEIIPGDYQVVLTLKDIPLDFGPFILNVPDPAKAGQPFDVQLQTTHFEPSASVSLWEAIKSIDLDFRKMQHFVDAVICPPTATPGVPPIFPSTAWDIAKNRLPFVNVDEYSLVKYAIDAYVRASLRIDQAPGYFGGATKLPYFQHLSESLSELACDYMKDCQCSQPVNGQPGPQGMCKDLYESRVGGFFALELIWTYWWEQAMVYQATSAINLRFQNMPGLHEVEPLMRFDTSPLRPLSNLMWGFIQDEQHRTSLHRRVFEYQHAYNLFLIGRAVPRQMGVDNRSMFLESFHNMLTQASLFYKDFDDKTRQADAFPLLTSLRDVHLLLAEGNQNAYQNMTYTTRVEVLTMQYLLGKSEMRLFLGGKPMVAYPQNFMGCLETMKSLQGWDPASVLHYHDLATCGERILLCLRYGDWTTSNFNINDAGNFAVTMRDDISRYVNAYRAVTGVDLSADALRVVPEERAMQPSELIFRRLSSNQPRNFRRAPSMQGAMSRPY